MKVEEPTDERRAEEQSEEDNSDGQAIVEMVASICIVLPLIIAIVFAILEISQFFLIQLSLHDAANRAVRQLAIEYWKDPAVAYDRGLQDQLVFDNIRIANVINDSDQFESVNYDLVTDPKSVSLTVTFDGGEHGLPTFPRPDPLGLGERLKITATATHAIE